MAVSVEVRKLRVRSLDIDFHEISWEIESLSSSVDIFDYTFTVLRSGGAEGPYEEITPALEDTFLFIDNNIPVGNIYRQIFYKIRVTEKSSGATKDFGPVQREPDPDLIALELRKHMNLLFREFAGRRCWVFPIRTFGQRCECFNTTLQKRTRSRCLTCYDTGFVRGYFSPIEAFMSIDPSASGYQQTNVGELQQQNTTARMGYFPPLKPRDLVVEGENNRWRIVQVTQTEHSRASILQEVQIHRIPTHDIESAIKFDIGNVQLKDLFITPARNFTNPHSLEGFMEEEIPGVFSLYKTTYPTVKT
jgi:hypothetical protein